MKTLGDCVRVLEKLSSARPLLEDSVSKKNKALNILRDELYSRPDGKKRYNQLKQIIRSSSLEKAINKLNHKEISPASLETLVFLSSGEYGAPDSQSPYSKQVSETLSAIRPVILKCHKGQELMRQVEDLVRHGHAGRAANILRKRDITLFGLLKSALSFMRHGIIFTLIFGTKGIIFMVIGSFSVENAKDSVNWPATDGLITTSRIEIVVRKSRRYSKTTGYTTTTTRSREARVFYDYQVNGQHYSGDKVSYKSIKPDDAVNKYPKGKKLRVHYNPDDPSTSVIEPGYDYTVSIPFWAGFGLLCIGLGVTISIGISEKRSNKAKS
ncbi:MAG: DUF3592 domain-containing protein [Spirochaetota bacterium]|nr:DUF3592 domain-containing protein [Spirochaetota bacterium]